MEVMRAPSGITGPVSASVIPSLSSNNKSCMVRVLPLQSSFFAHGVGALTAPGLRTSYSNRVQCHGVGWGAAGAGMNLFGRLARIIRSYANAIVSYFEDPEKIIDQAVLEMNNDLLKMRNATAQTMASQKQLEEKYKAAENASNHWYKRAQRALRKGDEAFARGASKRRKDFADNQKLIGEQLDQLKGLTENLLHRTRLLESKIWEAKTKKEALKARAVSAKTASTLRDMVDNVNGSGALAAFEMMEEKVMMLEYQAESNNRYIRDDLEEKFAALEGPSLDDELEDLKRERYRNSETGELPLRRPFPRSSPFSYAEFDLEEEHLVS